MHQHYYKDALSNSFLLPWVRLRAAKDYYKMPALLDGYPDVKLTFNLVPALVEQIQDYVDGGVQDVYMELARRPVSGLSADERGFVARWMTEAGPPVSTLPGTGAQAGAGRATHSRRLGHAVLGRRAARSARVVQPVVDRPRGDGRQSGDCRAGPQGPVLFGRGCGSRPAGAVRAAPQSAPQISGAAGTWAGRADHQPLLSPNSAPDPRSWNRARGTAGPQDAARDVQARGRRGRTATPWDRGASPPFRAPAARRLAAGSRRFRRRGAAGRRSPAGVDAQR